MSLLKGGITWLKNFIFSLYIELTAVGVYRVPGRKDLSPFSSPIYAKRLRWHIKATKWNEERRELKCHQQENA